MISFPSFAGLADAFIAVLRRFTLPLLVAVVGTVFFVTFIEIESHHGSKEMDWMVKVILCCLLALPSLTAAVAFSEERNQRDWRKWALQAGVLALCAGYYFSIDLPRFEMRHIFRFPGLLATAHLAVAVAPYLNRLSVVDFWKYNQLIFSRLATGLFFTFLIFLGLAGAMAATDQLFKLHIDGVRYPQLFIILLGIFNTAYLLFHFPAKFTWDADSKEYMSLDFSVLCKFILIPVSLLYLFILYLFSAKILLEWELPRGWVSSLVIGFATVGIFTWLLNYLPARIRGEQPFVGFARWFWAILLPMVGLLFVGVGRSIYDYGVTEERFIVAHIGVWLLVNSLYFIFSKKDNLKFIPISLALFILLATYGPLNMFNVSRMSQTKQLNELLSPLNRWEDGRLKTGTEKAKTADYDRIADIITYITRHNDIAAQHPEFLSAIPDSIYQKREYEQADLIIKWLNIGSAELSETATKSYNFDGEEWTDVPVPAGADRLIRVFASSEKTVRGKDETEWFALDSTGTDLLYYDQDILLDRFNLLPALDQWRAAADTLEYKPVPLQSIPLIGVHSKLIFMLDNTAFSHDSVGYHLEYLRGMAFFSKKPTKQR